MEIFKKLESLRFFEWLKEKGFGSGFTPMILDAQPFDSIERSGYNAIAFRWFRVKYNLYHHIHKGFGFFSANIILEEDRHDLMRDKTVPHHLPQYYQKHKTYEEAELECLKKLIQIVKEK